jgi:hypothetical protein
VTSGWILLISFVAIAAGIAAGMLLRQRLGEERLESAKEMIRLGAASSRRCRRC